MWLTMLKSTPFASVCRRESLRLTILVPPGGAAVLPRPFAWTISPARPVGTNGSWFGKI